MGCVRCGPVLRQVLLLEHCDVFLMYIILFYLETTNPPFSTLLPETSTTRLCCDSEENCGEVKWRAEKVTTKRALRQKIEQDMVRLRPKIVTLILLIVSFHNNS